VCQRVDKAKPPNSPMQLREVVTVPFERVSIDIVGPFPNAKGGCRYLLTCIDLATRWPDTYMYEMYLYTYINTRYIHVFIHCMKDKITLISLTKPPLLSSKKVELCMN